MTRKPRRPVSGSSGQEQGGNDYFFVQGEDAPALSWVVQSSDPLQVDLDYQSYVSSGTNATTYIPLLLTNDNELDGNNTLVFTIESDKPFGFTQPVYRFKESDGEVQIGIGPKPSAGQTNNTFSEAVIIIEDVGITDSNNVLKTSNIIFGTNQSERITGTSGVDILYGGSVNPANFISSISDRNTGNDTLEGLAGDDHLYGWDGDDRLDGGVGSDYLFGGAGRDRFELRNPPAASATNPITNLNELSDVEVDQLKNVNIDIVGDFNVTEDSIGVYVGTTNGATIFSQAGLTPNQSIAPDQLRIGSESTTAAQRFIYNPVSGLLSFDADGSGASPSQQIALLSPDLALANTNILPFNDDAVVTSDPTDIPGAINGTNGNDNLTGGSGSDILNGKLGNDILKGKAGQDTLIGGDGSDRSTGNKGRDTFVLETGAGVDRILDFKDKQDRLGLSSNSQFQNLKIVKKGQNTLIRLGSDRLAFLENTPRNLITAADFTSSPIF